MGRKLILFFTILFTICFAASTFGQNSSCDSECVKTVHGLLKMSYSGFSASWLEKANSRLGDKAGIGVLEIYKGKSLYKADNIRTYLPVLKNAFLSPTLIEGDADKKPYFTLIILQRLKSKIRDHFLRREVIETMNSIVLREVIQS